MRQYLLKSWLLMAVAAVAFGCSEPAPGNGGNNGSDTGTDTSDAATDTDEDAGDSGEDGDIAPNCAEDMCGVCDDDPTNDCVQDCNGDWGGDAEEDMCGVCDDDPSNDCVQDCAGEWDGDAVPDNCGVCDDDASNDCAEDCAGEWGGDAVVDDCGVCDDDSTNDCDCAGTPGGSATEDMCGTCDADASNDCAQDCNGDWGGDAMLDGCGTCDDDPSNDCTDDCNGVAGGPAMLDMCGVCDDDPSNDCTQDCAGSWGGSAVEDMCGTCDVDATNDCTQDCAGDWGGTAAEDMCGVCDADPANDCTQDCNNDWGGTAAVDVCGRCAGGNTSLTACPTIEISPEADAYVGSASSTANNGTSSTLEVTAESRPNTKRIYMRFPLSGIPQDAHVMGVELRALAYDGFAWGGDGNVYTQFVQDDTWTESGITWNNMPAPEADRLGHWWLWYDNQAVDRWGINDSELLAGVVSREYRGDGLLSVRLHSPGYNTSYRSREYADASKRPKLVVGYMPMSTVTLEPSADSYVDGGTSPRGSDAHLYVDPNAGPNRTFVRFDLSSLPAWAQVVEATMSMTAYTGFPYGGDGNVYARLVSDDSWTEAGLIGSNQPSAAADNLGYWWLWFGGSTPNQVGSFTTDALRAAVQSEFEGDGEISLRFHSPGYRTRYRSREYSTASERPKLEIRYINP